MSTYSKIESESEYYVNSEEEQEEINSKYNWIKCNDRYGGQTQKRKDKNDNWEYKTRIFDKNAILKVKINESFIEINNQKHLAKTIYFSNKKILLELSSLDSDKQLDQNYKVYDNEETYTTDLKSLDLKNFISLLHSENEILHQSINWWFVIATCGIIPLIIYVRTAQRVFSVNITDGKNHTFVDSTNSILNTEIIDEDGNIQYNWNVPIAISDIIFTLISSEILKWSRKNMIPCCQNRNNTTISCLKKSYGLTIAINLLLIIINDIVFTGSSMYTNCHDCCTWEDYSQKLINKYNVLSIISRLYVMTLVNDIFKWSLNTLNSEFKISEKFNYCTTNINIDNDYIKFIVAWLSFGIIIFSSNGMKTFASLVVKARKIPEWKDFNDIFFTWEMLGISVAVTLTDALSIILQDYQKPIIKTCFKWCWEKIKSCFANNENSYVQEGENIDNIVTLTKQAEQEAKNKNLNFLFKKYKLNKEEFYDSLDNQPWLNNVDEINNTTDLQNQPSTSRAAYGSLSLQ